MTGNSSDGIKVVLNVPFMHMLLCDEECGGYYRYSY